MTVFNHKTTKLTLLLLFFVLSLSILFLHKVANKFLSFGM